ncbi:ATP-binding protein [Flavobacterium terrisoli]|uniref:ATP-binding protein n=1 Tax=Flavobacterium terrisoli TaxID=3242195 RepID=UPI002542877B|nr:ATP-binding protein [Flavobacterium buctense]
MNVEDKNKDYKSLKKAIGSKSDLASLAETCVCFANAQGGQLIIGIEDKDKLPPTTQKVSVTDMNEVVKRLRSLTDGVGLVNPEIITHENGGEYFIVRVLPSTRVIATTSSGKVLIRISDNCFPVDSTELTNLAAEKTAFQWEIIAPQKITLEQADTKQVIQFIEDIKKSDKVSEFIKQRDDIEILSFYQMISPENYLTNLGVLWLGTPAQRARLSYPITVQYIVYNEREEKIRKKEWHFHLQSPKELVQDIEKEAVELTYSTELPDGLFRKTVRQYPREVIRELLINAVAHKKYTISGDIFIEVFVDRMVITNPGSLPLGITKDNILHERHRRNPHLIQTLSDLKLMEGEGSGFDLIYEKLVRDAKPLPVINNDFTKVSVTVFSGAVDEEVISILDYIDNHFQLTQKEYITLGIVASEKKILSTQLALKLQLSQEDKTASWIGTLVEREILITRGEKKAREFLLNPELFSQAKLGIKPSLKTLEPYKLELLIMEDLRHNGRCKLSDIQKRLPEVPKEDIKKLIYKMVNNNDIIPEGAKKNRTYMISKKK